MEKIISNKAASFMDMKTAEYILERADLRADSILEQYRKSTDRNYTLAGLIMTVFMALTAYLAGSQPSLHLMLITVPLWAGLGIALIILLCKVVRVHEFMMEGDQPSVMSRDELVDVAMGKGLQDKAKANDELLHHLIISSIKRAERNAEQNMAYLQEQCRYVRMAMTAIVASSLVSASIAVIMLPYLLLG